MSMDPVPTENEIVATILAMDPTQTLWPSRVMSGIPSLPDLSQLPRDSHDITIEEVSGEPNLRQIIDRITRSYPYGSRRPAESAIFEVVIDRRTMSPVPSPILYRQIEPIQAPRSPRTGMPLTTVSGDSAQEFLNASRRPSYEPTATQRSPRGPTRSQFSSMADAFNWETRNVPVGGQSRTYEELRSSRFVNLSPEEMNAIESSTDRVRSASQRALDAALRSGPLRIISATPQPVPEMSISSRRYLTFRTATSLIQSGAVRQSIVDPENQEDVPQGLTRVTLIATDGNEYDVVAKYNPQTNQILAPV